MNYQRILYWEEVHLVGMIDFLYIGDLAEMYKVPQKKAPLKQNNKRLSKEEYKAYQTYIKEIGVCQVCEESTDLDTPHHTKQGIGNKDDRSIICICIACHSEIHTKGFSGLAKDRATLEEIGRINWECYKCE